MRKYLLALFVICLFAIPLQAAQNQGIGAYNVASVGCTASFAAFTPVTGATISTLYTSDTKTVTLSNCPNGAVISIAGNSGQYKINSGSYTASAGTVQDQDTVTVQQTSSGSNSTLTTTTLTIASSNQGYNVTTVAAPTNYLNDANFFMAWNFENVLTDMEGDSSPTGTFVIQSGGTMAYSTTGAELGTYSAALSTTKCLNIPYGNLQSTFPGRSGGAYTALTVGAWIRVPTTGASAYILGYNATGTYYESWQLDINSGKVSLRLEDTNHVHEYTAIGSTTLSTNTNYFVAGTWDGTTMKVYYATTSCSLVNDGNTTQSLTPYTVTSGALYAGGVSSGATCYYGETMYIDMPFVFNRALSSTELTEICTHGINGSK